MPTMTGNLSSSPPSATGIDIVPLAGNPTITGRLTSSSVPSIIYSKIQLQSIRPSVTTFPSRGIFNSLSTSPSLATSINQTPSYSNISTSRLTATVQPSGPTAPSLIHSLVYTGTTNVAPSSAPSTLDRNLNRIAGNTRNLLQYVEESVMEIIDDVHSDSLNVRTLQDIESFNVTIDECVFEVSRNCCFHSYMYTLQN